jgi:Fe2+ or Zn2+ uptake regulation protein
MGLFDYIEFETECPSCGAKVDGFQSKDGPCSLTTLKFWEVNSFHSICEKCNTVLEYSKKTPESLEELMLGLYERKTRKI